MPYASNGITEIQVRKRPVVALISTGAELVEPTARPSGSQIRDANRSTLVALLSECGVETLDLGIVEDDPAHLASALDDAVAKSARSVEAGACATSHHLSGAGAQQFSTQLDRAPAGSRYASLSVGARIRYCGV